MASLFGRDNTLSLAVCKILLLSRLKKWEIEMSALRSVTSWLLLETEPNDTNSKPSVRQTPGAFSIELRRIE